MTQERNSSLLSRPSQPARADNSRVATWKRAHFGLTCRGLWTFGKDYLCLYLCLLWFSETSQSESCGQSKPLVLYCGMRRWIRGVPSGGALYANSSETCKFFKHVRIAESVPSEQNAVH
ncbi:unnamed protein product [Ixodes pacificus]